MQSGIKSIQELLDIAMNDGDIPYADGTIDVYSFLELYDIKPGHHKVTSRAIHALYKKWSKNPIEQRTFSLKLGLYLQRTKNNFFLINKDPLKYILPLLEKKSYVRSKFATISYKKMNFFFEQNKWEKGPYFQEAVVLYYIYAQWCKKNKVRRIPNVTFYKIMNMKFLSKKKGTGKYQRSSFGINQEYTFTKRKILYIKKWHNGKTKSKKQD